MEWHLHPDTIALTLLLVGLYYLGARWAGRQSTPVRRLTRAQQVLYLSGVALLYLGGSSPMHDLSERYLFSVHMLQHTVFSLIAPPLMLLGVPGWMLRPLIRNAAVRRVAYQITRPFPAFFIFNLVIVVTHLTVVMHAVLMHHSLHLISHTVLTASAFLMWFPVLSPLRELPRIGPFAQLVYLFVQSLVPGVIASFLVFSDKVVYEFYLRAPERVFGLSVLDDQRYAAVFMKLIAATILWFVMAVVFFRWFGEEDRRMAARDDVRWDEVEQELERMGLTRREQVAAETGRVPSRYD